ncbi:tyrosine-protein kinase [Streptococcus ovuberis]|uniref:Tyrosine-protein kinase CpsD n=1 Tax=Streptococcus ovuberis TaxID=1936207 RepID=A0A7X6MZR5_9STRE|nr:tyrosine-protein kinase [Streptococcus ovuberis]NKZ19389.1 tyrosine-protein kinase [Streptococcus ovuberis]
MPQLELVKTKAHLAKQVEEYFNAIRTNIQFSGRDIRTIVLTSVQPNEGKSTTSVNLAISLANAGFKTLLIDADTRNSILSGTFKVNGKIQGLSSYLSGNCGLADILCETDIANLMVVMAGQVPPNPTSLLQNTNFRELLSIAREVFDYVIVDSPPIGLVIDAAIIAQQCDGAVLVTEVGAIKRKFIQKAKEQLEQSGTQFLGVILNKVDHRVDNYGGYGSYGQYGQYGNYGK